MPHAFSSFPVQPRRRGESSAASLLHELLCTSQGDGSARRHPLCRGFSLFFCHNEASVSVRGCAHVAVCLYFCGALCPLLPIYLNPVSWSSQPEAQALCAWYPPSFNVFLLSSQQEPLSIKPLSFLLKLNLLLLQRRDHRGIPMGVWYTAVSHIILAET